jgi:hypothetical protein
MQTERANCKQRIDEIKSKVEESNQVIIRLNNEKGELVGEFPLATCSSWWISLSNRNS